MKKIIYVALLIILVVISTSCQEEKEEVNLYNWGDYIEPSLAKEFEDETGIRVNIDTFETNEDMIIKLTKTGTEYDLAIPSDYMIERMIKNDMLQKIELGALENYKNIDEAFLKPSYDPTGEYSIPYLWGTVGIAYNTEMVDDVVDSWDILWNEKYKGDIIMLNSQRDTIGVALRKLGYSMNSRDSKELNEAKEILIEQKPLVLAYLADDTKDAMVGEEGAMAVIWSGEAYVMNQENEKIEYSIPKEGSNIWFDSIVMLKDAPNKDNAMKFIDFLLRAESSAKNVEYIGYSTPIPEALEILGDEYKNNHIINPDLDSLPPMEIFVDPEDIISEYDAIWLEVTTQ